MTKRKSSAISSILYNHFPFLATTWVYNTLRSHSIGAWIEGGTPDNKGKRLCGGGSWLGHVIVRASRKRSDLGSNDSHRPERFHFESKESSRREWERETFFFHSPFNSLSLCRGGLMLSSRPWRSFIERLESLLEVKLPSWRVLVQ
jgi:hypothetical protein